VAKAKASTEQFTTATGHRTASKQQGPGGPACRRGIERLLGDPGVRKCPPATLAAPGEERRSPGVGPDRMRRTPGALQTAQEVTGLAVHNELRIQHHP
jgi:hypothetical protein